MDNEISKGTILGITLIALAAIIGLGFGVFSIAKGVANEGVVNVQDNLGAVSESAFADFNQKIVTGTQVMSAYDSFKGKPVCILINTQAMTKEVKTHKDHATAYVYAIGGNNYIMYNAMLAASAEGAVPSTKATGGNKVPAGDTATMTLKDGIVTTKFGFVIDATTGKVQFDPNIGGFSKAGNCEFISPSAKFDANLVKDASGTNVGVVFTQLPK